MENIEIARALSEVADLLEIEGENPFKVRAYRNAVCTIGGLTRQLSEMVAGGEDLEELPGVGHDIAAYIAELVESGHLKRLERLERKIPPSLTELMRIEGLGRGPRRDRGGPRGSPAQAHRVGRHPRRSPDAQHVERWPGQDRGHGARGRRARLRIHPITDHSPSVAVARGLDVKRLEAQWREIAQVRRKLARRIKILRGMEVDILRDGSLDLPDEMLARLDIVVVSIHSQMRMSKRAMTDRVLRGIAHPFVDILAPPTGRLINRRTPVDIDLEAVFAAAADNGVAVELNAQPDRLDLGDVQVRRAKELGVPLVIDTDAHSTATLDFMRYGVDQARRGWLEAKDVLNTSSFRDLSDWSRRKRERVAKGIRNQNRNRDYIRRVAAVVE